MNRVAQNPNCADARSALIKGGNRQHKGSAAVEDQIAEFGIEPGAAVVIRGKLGAIGRQNPHHGIQAAIAVNC